MTKLSRTERYRQLREQMEEETAATSTPAAEGPRPLRSAAPDVRGSHETDMAQNAILNNRAAQPKRQAVMDELLGEVKQYNIDRGQRVTEDTQINILETLAEEDPDGSIRRSQHLEEMEEEPMDVGGTTMRISPTKAAPAGPAAESEPAPVRPAKASLLEKQDLLADEVDEKDALDVYALGADDLDASRKPARQSQAEPKLAPSRKDEKEARKAKKKEQKLAEKKAAAAKAAEEARRQDAGFVPPSASEASADEDIPADKSSRFWNVVLIILSLVLIAAIAVCVYALARTGLLG